MAELPQILKQRFFDANGAPLAGGKLYSYQAGSTIPQATFTDSTGLTAETNPVILDANGETELWVGQGIYKFVLTDADDVVQWTVDNVKSLAQLVLDYINLINTGTPIVGGAVPPGGATGAALVKASASDGDVAWKNYNYSGFSARFGATFTSTNLDDTLQKILNLQYTGPAVALAASGNGTIREKGTAVTATTLTASITKRSDPIAAVRYYLGGTLLATHSSPTPGGGTDTYGWTGSFSDNTTFNVQVDDSGATGGPTTASASAGFTFVYPYYMGAGAAGLSPSAVAALTKLVINSTATAVETITAGAGNVFYFAYPAAYGSLTSILDVNGFETIPDWTASTSNITGLDGTAVSYKIYQFNNPVTAGSYQYTFKR